MENIIGKILEKEYSVLISENGNFQEKQILNIQQVNLILLTKKILGIEINIENE